MRVNFSPHTLILRAGGHFLLYQPVTRKGTLMRNDSFTALNDFLDGKRETEGMIFLEDISTFSLAKCLLDNPNGLLNESVFEKTLSEKPFSEALSLLQDQSILVVNNDYLKRAGKRVSLFDKEHTGNFHQLIGEYVLKNKDINAEMWWITQKFSDDYRSTTDTPYKWVQEVFMNDFFTSENVGGKKLLDFGSGIGYYSNFFHKLGASVTGIDPSEKYIDIAKEIFAENGEINFLNASFEKRSDFAIFQETYDVIFLSDVFLYYFEPYKKMELTPAVLLQELNNILNPNGRIYILDPHGIFHLQPWFSKSNTPFLLALEYANRKYRVTPNIEEISLAVESADMAISKIREIKYKGNDPEKMFYAEFPFWWFFELIKTN